MAMNLTLIEYQPQKSTGSLPPGGLRRPGGDRPSGRAGFFPSAGFQERILARLADSMPTARKKEDVPRWFILAANLSFEIAPGKLLPGFRAGGALRGTLIALPTDLATKHLDAKTRQWACIVRALNDKNAYDRATRATRTPCARRSRM